MFTAGARGRKVNLTTMFSSIKQALSPLCARQVTMSTSQPRACSGPGGLRPVPGRACQVGGGGEHSTHQGGAGGSTQSLGDWHTVGPSYPEDQQNARKA